MRKKERSSYKEGIRTSRTIKSGTLFCRPWPRYNVRCVVHSGVLMFISSSRCVAAQFCLGGNGQRWAKTHAINVHRFGLCTDRQDESNVFFPPLRASNVREAGLAEADKEGVTARRHVFASDAGNGGSRLRLCTRLPPATLSSHGAYAAAVF